MPSYNDILSCRRPVSRRLHMPVAHRAKQFAPFDALKGYEESVHNQEIRYEAYRELSEDRQDELNRRLLQFHIGDLITTTFFVREPSQPGISGYYKTITGTLNALNLSEHHIKIDNIDIDFRTITNLDKSI